MKFILHLIIIPAVFGMLIASTPVSFGFSIVICLAIGAVNAALFERSLKK